MKIIAPTDFQSHATWGTTAAATLAGKMQDRLLLIHAVPSGSGGVALPEVLNLLPISAHEKLAAEAARLRQLGAEVDPILVYGSADLAILNQVVPTETRCIVLSSRGRLGATQGAKGHTAEYVAQSSPVPTLVVRRDRALLSWLRGQHTLKVICAFDYSLTADAALDYLKELLRVGPCEIVVAHVNSPLEDKERLGVGGPARFDGNEPEVQRILERDLSEAVSRVLGETRARLRVQAAWGRPDYELLQIARDEHADLMVTGTHQRQGLDRLFHLSVSRALLRYAPTNVLVVPSTRDPNLASPRPPRRVLAATDFSDAGNQAVHHAVSLLGTEGTVLLLHVAHPRVFREGRIRRGVVRRTHGGRVRHLQSCSDQLRALVPSHILATGVRADVEVLEDRKPADAIVRTAERFGADVICLGTHGIRRVATALRRSVAQAVIERSRRPVLVVHDAPP